MELGRRTTLYFSYHLIPRWKLTFLTLTLIYTYIAGKVAEIKAEKAEVTSNKGNVISKNGTEEDPAVVIERSGVSPLAI